MTERITPERLAELREDYDRGIDAIELMLDCLASGINVLDHRNKGRDNWIVDLQRYQADHVALLAEVEHLRAELASEIEDSRATIAATEERATRMAW